MKREDFKNINEEHRKICEEVIAGRTNCKDIECKNCMFANSNVKNRKNCFYNKYVLREDFGNNNYVDELFIKSCKLFLETFFNDELNIEKEDVLTIEHQEVFDCVAFRIVYQNEEVLKRGIFRDKEINVYSENFFAYYANGSLFIRGEEEIKDNFVEVVSKEKFKDIENKVRLINEKYGIEKKWRAEIWKDYFYISTEFNVIKEKDLYTDIDNEFYAAGNYFKSLEVAEKVASEFKKVVTNVKGGK